VLSAIAQAQARAEDIPGAMTTAREIANPRHRPLAVSAIARSLARAEDVAGAIAIAREIADLDYRVAELTSIAEAQARAGNGRSALEAIDAFAFITAAKRARGLAGVASELDSPRP
jgi:hypothetical protein